MVFVKPHRRKGRKVKGYIRDETNYAPATSEKEARKQAMKFKADLERLAGKKKVAQSQKGRKLKFKQFGKYYSYYWG